MKTNFIFFDCWDTLIEYHEHEVSIFDGLNKYLLNERNEKANVDEIKYFLNVKEKIFNNYFSQNLYELPFELLYNLVLKTTNFSLSVSENKWEDINNDYLLPKPIFGIVDFLSWCKENKISTAVLSNSIYSHKFTKKCIEETLKINMNDYFSFMLVSSEIGPKKPNPDFFKAGMGQAKIINSFAFYVGDSVVADVLGSINSGLKPCYFNWKKNKSQRTASINNLFTFEKYDELKDFIKKEGEYNPEIISKLELGVHKNEW